MGILNLAEEVAGAVAADKLLETADPEAGFLAKAAGAIAGFEGVEKLQEHFQDKDDNVASDDNTDNNA